MSGDRGSVSGVLVCWSLDLGSTPDRSLSFSFPLDHLGLCMLTSNLGTLCAEYEEVQKLNLLVFPCAFACGFV